jgi:hypothetical protein
VKYIAARFKKDIKYGWDDIKTVLLAENKRDLETAAKKGKKLEKQGKLKK